MSAEITLLPHLISLFPQEIRTSLFPTEIRISLFPQEIRTSLFPTEIRISLFPQEIRTSLFPTEIRISLFPQEIRTSLFPTEIRISLFPQEIRTCLFTAEIIIDFRVRLFQCNFWRDLPAAVCTCALKFGAFGMEVLLEINGSRKVLCVDRNELVFTIEKEIGLLGVLAYKAITLALRL